MPPELRKRKMLYGKKIARVVISSEETLSNLNESDAEEIEQQTDTVERKNVLSK